MVLAPGTMVTAKVRLIAPLGEGGMGVVWLGEHLELGCNVAIKFLSGSRARGERKAVERFRREAKLAASLTSPHAVRIFDHGVMENGAPYMVMERLEGETLAERLARSGRSPLEDVAAIVAQLGGVLADAHERGIVHRDIKPSNVFLVATEYDLFVKLLDFGVAKWLHDERPSELTEEGATVGTPHYMSPEQLLDAKTLDHRTDLWSLGVVAYHAVTGMRPFERPTAAGLTAAICNGELVAASSRVDGLPAALDAWFAKALSVTVDDRFAGAREMARGFADALGQGAPGLARSSASPDRPRRPIGTEPELPTTLTGTASATPRSSLSLRAPRTRLALGLAASALALIAAMAFRTRESLTTASATSAAAAAASPRPPDDQRDAASTAAASAAIPVIAKKGAAADTADPPRTNASSPAAPSPARAPASARAAAAPSGRPAYCATDHGFFMDERGHLEPKPECL